MPVDITPIGLAFLLAISLCLIVQPRTLIWILSAAIPFSHASMITVGDNGLSPFWVTAIAAIGRLGYLVIVRARRGLRLETLTPRMRGATVALIVFGVYAAVITIIGPLLFRGMPVISARGGLDSQIDNFTPLAYSVSNLAQLAYLVIGIGLVLYLIAEPPSDFRAIEAAIVLGFALTLFKHFFPDFWPQAWFDSNPSYTYHWISPSARERGPFAEPSLLGVFVSMSLAYIVAVFSQASTWRLRAYYALLGLIGLYLLGVSYTGTALITLSVVVGAALLALIVSLFRRSTATVRWIALGAAAVVGLVAVLLRETLAGATIDLIVEKLASESFSNRGASNENALQVFFDSFGIGVGLGSDRPSSLLFLLLSCVGAAGTVFFLRAMVGYASVGFQRRVTRPLAWAFFAQAVAQFIANPDLSTPALWFLIGLLATSYDGWAQLNDHHAGTALRSAGTSLWTWIPRELKIVETTTTSLPVQPGGSHLPTRRYRRRKHPTPTARRRAKLLGGAAATGLVMFFGAAGYDGYAAQHQAASAVEQARSDLGMRIETYADTRSSVESRLSQALSQNEVLSAVLQRTKPDDVVPAYALDDFRTAVERFRLTTTSEPSSLPSVSEMQELTTYTPPGAGMDARSARDAIRIFSQRLDEVDRALTALRDYRLEVDESYSAAMKSFVSLSHALSTATKNIDLHDAPTPESEALSAAIRKLDAIATTEAPHLRYDRFVAVLTSRNSLLQAIEAERLEQERLDRARERAEREQAQSENEDPVPTPDPTPSMPAPTPVPTEPTPTPAPTEPAPEPLPTEPAPEPTEPTTPGLGDPGTGSAETSGKNEQSLTPSS